MSNEFLAIITECPSCRAALSLPHDAAEAGELECPACDARFALATAVVREVRMARVVPPIVPLEPTPSFLPELPLAAELAESDAGAEELIPPHEVDFVDPEAATIAFSPDATVRIDDEFPVDEFADADLAAADDFDHEPAFAPSPERAADAEDSHDTDDFAETDDFAQPDDFAHANDFAAPDHDFDMRPAPRPARRRSSTVRTLVGIVGGGLGGLLLAGYALLWLRGPSGDLFQMAPWLPQAMLPPSMQTPARRDLPPRIANRPPSTPTGLPAEAPTNEQTAAELAPASGEVAINNDVQVDPEVTPASSTEPVIADSPAPAATPDATATVTAPPAPPIKPNWPATPIVADLTDARLYSLAELTEAAAAAENAGRRFVSGDLARPDSVRDMGQAYVQLCAAAERLTLTDPAAYGPTLFTQQALAKEPMNLTAGSAARRHDLSVIAARWLQHNKRQNEGVLFVGRVRDMQPRGAWTEYHIDIAFGDQTLEVPVLMDKLRFATGAEAAIAGVIVKDPQRRIAGYQGDAPQVVVAGYAFDPARYANANATESPAFELPDK